MKNFRSVQKNLKNSAVNPSFPRVFKFFIFFNASASSEYLISPSNNSASLSVSLELFSPYFGFNWSIINNDIFTVQIFKVCFLAV